MIWVLSQLFTLIKRFFSSSSFSAIRVVSSPYLRLLIFLQAVLIPACNSSSLSFHMTWSVYELNKQGDNKQPCCTPFSILNQSVVPYKVLTVSSWTAYRFFRRQVRCSGFLISLKVSHSLLWSTQSKTLEYSMKQRVFFGNSLLFLWFSKCWQFDLWFLSLF